MTTITEERQLDRLGEFLATGTIYGDLDDAMHAASCLCHLHPDGATVYCTTEAAHVLTPNGEAYQVACAGVRVDGTGWAVPPEPYHPVYNVRRVGPR